MDLASDELEGGLADLIDNKKDLEKAPLNGERDMQDGVKKQSSQRRGGMITKVVLGQPRKVPLFLTRSETSSQ